MMVAARRDDEACGRADPRQPADVAHVAAVRGHDERRATRDCGDETAGNEEVRIDDIGLEPSGCHERVSRELEVLALAATAPIEDRAFDVMSARRELFLERLHEHAEIGSGGPRIHLGDEQYLHRRIG